ncbi:GNAT family N-acetyltransferase [Histidinibacterium lentulum]|uniref:GNAT family N-acetyltransferase n=1 Tax=Histidinibacterium lentulum TaxID=2480588 RepID=A0A3N2R583_9RHOB|nr:GNAT family N-acetyltransferase [Histidinibacterium lentulum]ROU02557.1 GNAT family N-acetyltransferase [Histidinibacterium lentulum]
MIVRQGFEPRDRDSLARLYWAAFGGKLGRVLGPERHALAFVARVANPERALCVHEGGRLVGVAGFHAGGLALVGGGMSDLAAVYGRAGALWRGAALTVLERPQARGDLLVDGIFVADSHRGRGVGSALIEALAREALSRGLDRVRLDVTHENPRARALYERRGFVPVAQQSGRLLPWLFGFSGAVTMVRQVR